MVVNINIQEQRELLRSRFKVDFLTSDKANITKIQAFHSCKSGTGLESYLKENAWNEDQQGITKVYLIKDVETEDIVFFFALSAGLLYKEIGADDSKLSAVEKDIVDCCVKAILEGNNTFTTDDVFSWYEGEAIDKEKLQNLIDARTDIKMAAREDPEKSVNPVNVKQVSETFLGIVLTHFCKNADYSFSERLVFPIGFYAFWEIIVKEVLHIASLLGCRYLYLFAADNTEQTPASTTVTYSEYWDEGETDAIPVYKLVEYYKNELKFEDVQDITILKPYYDFPCFSLIQEIDKLPMHREAAWIQHSDVNA